MFNVENFVKHWFFFKLNILNPENVTSVARNEIVSKKCWKKNNKITVSEEDENWLKNIVKIILLDDLDFD